MVIAVSISIFLGGMFILALVGEYSELRAKHEEEETHRIAEQIEAHLRKIAAESREP